MEYGVLFPPFGISYLGTEYNILSNISTDLDYKFLRAREIVDINNDLITNFKDGTFQDELQSQYGIYIYSCAMSDVLKSQNISTIFVSGYSMGMYAALYHAEAISFDDGLRLIRRAYELARKVVSNSQFAMGTIVGLAEKNVRILLSNYNDIRLIGINNPHSYVISGRHNNVLELLDLAQKEGALSTRLVPTSMPYHSSFMADTAIEFENFVKQIKINPPAHIVVSSVTPRFLITSEDIRHALRQNIDTPLDWLETMILMVQSNIRTFIECGPGKSLTKINKFIPGIDKTYNISNFFKDSLVTWQ
jgi:[acyl-carrier-protein] S-malonyltransferase